MQLKEPSNARSLFDEGQMETPYSNSNAGQNVGQNAGPGYYNGQNQGGMYGGQNPNYNNPDSFLAKDQFYGQRPMDDLGPISVSNPVIPSGNDKSKVIKITIACVAGLIFFFACFWFFTEQPWRKGGIKDLSEADQVVQSFIDSLLSGDVDQVESFFKKYTPSEVYKSLKSNTSYSELVTVENSLKQLKDSGVSMDITYTTFYKTRLTDVQIDLLKSQEKDMNIKDAYYVDVPFKMTASYMGKTQSQNYNYRFTFIRLGKRWYLYNAQKTE